jgi:hypothetical protein
MVSLRHLLGGMLIAAGLAACGASHATAPSAAQQAGARQLAAGEAALAHASSVRVTTVLHTGQQTSRSIADIVPGNRMEVVLSLGDARSQLRLTGGYAYLHGNAAYWKVSGTSAASASLLAPHWFKLPVNQLSNAQSLLALMHSSTLGECTLGLTASTTTVTAHHAGTTILTQRGDATTDQISLRSSSHRPIIEQRTGPGAASAVCGTSTSTQVVRTGTTTFTRYGVPVTVTVPAHALDGDQMTRLMSAISRHP